MLQRIIVAIAFIVGCLTAAMAQEWNISRPGQNYLDLNLAAPDYNLCQAMCRKDANCKAWTYVKPPKAGAKARCFLKSAAPPKVKDDCCISGVKATDTSDRDERCRDYADRAVNQNKENEKLKCGFKGEQWSSNRAAHLAFCSNVPSSQVTRTSSMREEQLMACRKTSGQKDAIEDVCRGYAEEAVEQNQQNRRLGCGLTGRRWLSDFSPHFNWCMSATRNDRENERSLRARDLAICRGSGGAVNRADACRAFAEEAVQQSTENRLLNCGITGERWHGNYTQHYNWCMSTDGHALQNAREDRARAIKRCRDERKDANADRAAACRNYADEAAAQNAENRRLACGFTGFRWQSSTANHYAWCMTADRAERDAEARARETALARCRAETGGSDAGMDCGDYARRSIEQVNSSRVIGCGFEGAEWSRDFEEHLSWCRAVAPYARKRLVDNRDALLKICTSNPGRTPFCRGYANKAVAQFRSNMEHGCGFSGSRWHGDYQDHFVWCMGISPPLRELETLARDQALETCRR